MKDRNDPNWPPDPIDPVSDTQAPTCAATQAAHRWLGAVLSARAAACGDHNLAPPARLIHERAARALAPLLLAWAEQAQFDPAVAATYDLARGQRLELVFQVPPDERPGCAQCPARCRMLHLVGRHLGKLGPAVSSRLSQGASAASRVEFVTLAADKELPALARRQDAAFRSGLLYCLVTNTPATDEKDRTDVLALLRQAATSR